MDHRLAVLVSGTGSLLQAILDARIPVSLVMADRDCRGLEIAEERNIATALAPRSFGEDFDRARHTRLCLAILQRMKIDTICMAGWMTIFDKALFDVYGGRITNNHPSLLPAFKGEHAVRDALDYGVKVTGCTIHIATAELDAGPILEQEAVRVQSGDTVESLHERIKTTERPLLVRVLRQMLADEL